MTMSEVERYQAFADGDVPSKSARMITNARITRRNLWPLVDDPVIGLASLEKLARSKAVNSSGRPSYEHAFLCGVYEGIRAARFSEGGESDDTAPTEPPKPPKTDGAEAERELEDA